MYCTVTVNYNESIYCSVRHTTYVEYILYIIMSFVQVYCLIQKKVTLKEDLHVLLPSSSMYLCMYQGVFNPLGAMDLLK